MGKKEEHIWFQGPKALEAPAVMYDTTILISIANKRIQIMLFYETWMYKCISKGRSILGLHV